MKKEDMRTIRTRKSLRKALHVLMEKEPVDKISVTDICNEAEINRVTFYTHYNDKYELLHDLLKEVFKHINTCNKQIYEQIKTGDPIRDFTIVMSHSIYKVCFENKNVVNSISNYDNRLFVETLENVVINSGLDVLEELKNNFVFKYPAKFIINFLFGGFSKLIEYGLKNDELTEKEFLEYVDTFFYSLLKKEIFFTKK